MEFQNSQEDDFNLKFSTQPFLKSNLELLSNIPMQLSHNSSLSNCVIMEEDCEDASPNLPPKMEMMDLTHLFGAFTQQMTSHIDKLHDQLRLNDERTVQSQLAFR